MDPTTPQFFGDKHLKRKLVQSVSSVKKKIKALNEGKAELTTTLQETFQPITKPLNTLLDQIQTSDDNNIKVETTSNIINDSKKKKNLQLKLKKKTKVVKSSASTSEESNNDSHEEEEEDFEDADTSIESALLKPEASFQYNREGINPLAQTYIDNMIIDKVTKVPYGVQLQSDGYHVGDSEIDFLKNHFVVKNEKFKYTPGLMELLFKREPNTSLIQLEDSNNYYKIITLTNAHRRNYSSTGQIQGDRSHKYTKYLKQQIQPSPAKNKQGGCLISSSSSSSSKIKGGDCSENKKTEDLFMKKYYPNTDLKYWDDPNELVDRLRLLIASQNAGNTGHGNEIIAIIEELVEANIIEPLKSTTSLV